MHAVCSAQDFCIRNIIIIIIIIIINLLLGRCVNM